MRDLVVVIPGITGSVLRRDGRDLWDLSLSAVGRGLAAFTRTVGALRLPDDVGSGPAPTHAAMEVGGLIRGWHLWPAIAGGPGYRDLLARLDALAAGAVRAFGYDWRLSNRHTARLLATRVEQWLHEWRRDTAQPEAKVVFVCHSMGGLVARYYIEVLGGREHTRRLITLGTPYRGSVNAIRALTGDAFGALRRPFGWDGAVTEAARSFPALHELLPTYRCVAGDGEPRTLGEAGLADLTTGMVTAGAAFHAEIADAVARNGTPPYPVHAFVGKRQATWQSVAAGGGPRRYARSQRGRDHRGDGTVPLFSAVPPEWTTTEGAIAHAVRHGGICAAEDVLDLVLDKIEPLDLGGVLAPPCELGLDLPDILAAGDPIPVRVDADREDLLLEARLEDPVTGEVLAQAELLPDGAGGYRTSFESRPGSWRVTVEAVAEHPPVSVAELLTVGGP
jgi:hypothetical protein